jgi:hypothetical protein
MASESARAARQRLWDAIQLLRLATTQGSSKATTLVSARMAELESACRAEGWRNGRMDLMGAVAETLDPATEAHFDEPSLQRNAS